ncbi:MAG: hypothetical protein JSW07_00090 [bacterium]|nr:MAG: hypothetical protein JSW07_00090 [bacterium]
MATFSFSGKATAKKLIYVLAFVSIFSLFVPNSFSQKKNKYDPTTLVFPSFLHTYGIRKATQFHLFLFTQNRTKFKDPQGLAVVRLAVWEDTTTAKDDDEVTVYGVNSGQNNIIYNKSMKSLGIYGLKEPGIQRLNRPRGIAANEKGDVYIADTGNHRIVKLFNPGHDLVFQKSVGKKGSAKSQFHGPCGVALDSRGKLYVTDSGNNRVQVFTNDLQFKGQWGEPGQASGQLSFPDGIAVIDKNERWNYYREEFVVIIDLNHTRIQQFTPQGNYLRGMTASEFDYPDCYLAYIALDYYNNIYVTDTRNHCIHKFDHHLKYITSYGRNGSGDKEFIEPRGITIYRRFGQVFVAEKSGAQYYWIGTDCFDFSVTKHSSRDLFQFKYFLTEPSFITTDILDSEQRLVTRLWTRQFRRSGRQTNYWSGRMLAVDDSVFIKEKYKSSALYQKMKLIPPGKYFVKYKIEPTYSSYRYFEKIITREFLK